jgi:hypothetical protein
MPDQKWSLTFNNWGEILCCVVRAITHPRARWYICMEQWWNDDKKEKTEENLRRICSSLISSITDILWGHLRLRGEKSALAACISLYKASIFYWTSAPKCSFLPEYGRQCTSLILRIVMHSLRIIPVGLAYLQVWGFRVCFVLSHL